MNIGSNISSLVIVLVCLLLACTRGENPAPFDAIPTEFTLEGDRLYMEGEITGDTLRQFQLMTIP